MDDAKLAAGLSRNLDGTFEGLVRAYGDRLYRFSLRLTASPEDAEEIAQDAFVRAYRALETYPAERIAAMALRPWLYQIALNAFRNRVRRKRLDLAPLDGDLHPADTRWQPEVVAERSERADDLAALIATLPPRQREAVLLRHIEELSYAEIAAVLEQPEGTIRANVHRGIGTLRVALQREEQEVG